MNATIVSRMLPLLLLPQLATPWPSQLLDHNLSFVQTVLGRLALEQRWSSTAIFAGRHVNAQQLNELIRWLHATIGVAGYSFNAAKQLPREHRLRDFMHTDAVALLLCRSSEEHIWRHLDKRMRGLRGSKLLVSLPGNGNPRELAELFERLWSMQFLNALVLYQGQIYGYTPYPKLHYYAVNQASRSLFAGRERNFRGYVVFTPAENDLPRVFFVTDPQTGKRQIRGFSYRIFAEFLRRHNASLVVSNTQAHADITKTSSVNMRHINQLIGSKQLEISLHAYTGIDSQQGILSYPLLKALCCLIVPVRNEMPRYMYLLRPFRWQSWMLLLAGIFYIAIALYWLSPVAQRSRGQRLALSLLEGLAQLLFLSPPTRIYAPKLRYFLLALLLAILGFLVTNWYSNQLSSFLTTILVGEQVDSFEQLIQQQQRILVKHYEVDMVAGQVPPPLLPLVMQLMDPVNASEQVTAFLNFNLTFSYPFTIERWQFFALQQQYAQKPLYRFSSICLGSPIIGYPMRHDSHFESPLKHFIMRVQSAGLFQHWLVSDFNEALKAGYVRSIDNLWQFKALDLDTLRLAWLVVLCGWLLATVTLLFEQWLAGRLLWL